MALQNLSDAQLLELARRQQQQAPPPAAPTSLTQLSDEQLQQLAGPSHEAVSELDALASGFADGLTFGWGDELKGGLDAATAFLGGKDAGNAYRRSVFQSRQHQQAAQEQHPLGYMGGQLGGTILPLLIPFAGEAGAASRAAGAGAEAASGRGVAGALRSFMTPRNTGLVSRVIGGAKVGGAAGVVSGAGHADDHDRFTGAVTGGTIGALLGGATPAVLSGLGAARSAGTNTLRNMFGSGATAAESDVAANAGGTAGAATSPQIEAVAKPPTRQGLDEFIRVMEDRGMTPQQAQEAIDGVLANDPGRKRMFVDLFGNAGVNRLKFLVKMPGQTADRAGALFGERNAGQLDRIAKSVFPDGRVTGHDVEAEAQHWYDTSGRQLYEPILQNDLTPNGQTVFNTQIARLMQDPAMQKAATLGDEIMARDRLIGNIPGRNPAAAAARDGEALSTTPDDLAAMQRDIENARSVTRQGGPQTLGQFVRRRGGISDDRGDVAQFAGDNRGFASFLNKTSGRSVDDMAQAAQEAGFFPHAGDSRITTREFMDALERDQRGSPIHADIGNGFEHDNARQVLRWYEQRGVDTSARGPRLQAELAEKIGGQSPAVDPAADSVARRLHYIKMGLDDMILRAQSGADKSGGAANYARSLVALKNHFVSLLDEAIPGYSQARAEWGGVAEAENAAKAGRAVLAPGTEPQAVAEYVRTLTPYQLKFYRAGIGDRLMRSLETTDREGQRNVANSLLNTRTKSVLRAALGEDDANRIINTLSEESQLFRNASRAAPGAGSDTGIVIPQMIEEATMRAATHSSVTGMLVGLARPVFRGITNALQKGNRDEAGRLLLQAIDDPKTAPQVRAFLEEVAKRVAQRVGNAQTSAAASAGVSSAVGNQFGAA